VRVGLQRRSAVLVVFTVVVTLAVVALPIGDGAGPVSFARAEVEFATHDRDR
jgi:hypothetical protein